MTTADTPMSEAPGSKRPVPAPWADPQWQGPNEQLDYRDWKGTGAPIVIDNGSWEWRADFASTAHIGAASGPRLISPNVTSRFRDKKTGKPVVYAGRDAVSPFLDPASRMNLRSPFESNILTTVDALEGMMDYTFLKLGLENESRVEHPIVMTEPVGNLNYSRKATTELLFEAYNVPSVCYGIDSLFSFHYNTPDPQQGGMIVSSSNEFTYVIPYSKDNGHFELLRRITYGGSQATQYFLRLLQAKYPTFPVRVSTNQAESLLYDYGYVSTDYMDELRSFDDQETLDEKDLVVQFPFSVAPEKAEKTEEEKREIEEKKREQGKRLQEQAARKKEERIAEMEAYIEELRAVVAIRETDPETYAAKLKWHQLRNDAALELALMEAETDLVKIRTGSNRHKKKTLEDYENEKPPATDLLDIPDDQLTEDQKREKRRQRTQKANWDARERQRRERDEAARKAEEALRKEEEKRTNDFQGWLAAKYERRKELVEKLRARKKLKQQLQDRRSQASKARMRTVAHLAKDDEAPTKRRRKGGNDGRTQSDSAKNKDLFPPSASDDGFGRDDEDWMVYREIGGKGDESDGEEMELAELGHMDELLARFDPDFVPDDMDEEEKALRHSIVYRLAHGAFGAEESFARSKAEQAAKVHQLHLNVERMRVPEVLFQPSIIGLDQAGIVEIISEILKRVERPTQDAFMRNVLVTGTHSRYPSLVERLEKELRAIRPVGSDLVVRRAQDPRLDAWRGAAKWCLEARDELQRASMTREMYQEAGEDYLVEWRYSNRK